MDKQQLHQRLMKAGKFCGCHQMPERSFFYHGYQFPVCARCTGVVLGQLVGYLTFAWFRLSWNGCSFFLFLMFLDWYLQKMGLLSSTNPRRLITGLLCGYALGQCYLSFVLRLFGRLTVR